MLRVKTLRSAPEYQPALRQQGNPVLSGQLMQYTSLACEEL